MENSGDMEPRCNPLQIDVFVQTLLFLGAKSFTHSFVAINRYYEVLKVSSLSTSNFFQYSFTEYLRFSVVGRKRRSAALRSAKYFRTVAHSSTNVGCFDR